MEERTYIFHILHPDRHERCEKKESELTRQDKDHLLGSLIERWQNNPPENQNKFIAMIVDGFKKKNNDLLMQKLLEENFFEDLH